MTLVLHAIKHSHSKESISPQSSLASFCRVAEPTQDEHCSKLSQYLVPVHLFDGYISALSHIAKMRISAKFAGVSSIALNADSYRNVSGHDVVAVTAHGIDSNYELRSALIGIKDIRGSQTAKVPKEEILRNASEQFPSNKMMISSVVGDNGSNFRSTRNSITDDSLGCAAHMIQLIVRDFTSLQDGTFGESQCFFAVFPGKERIYRRVGSCDEGKRKEASQAEVVRAYKMEQ